MSALPIQKAESILAELPQPKGPGARLKAARQSKDIGLDTVAAQLHLRRDMLIALEEDDYDHLPARVFIVGYMRNYARFIGLPAEAIIQSLDQFLPPEDKDKPGLPKVGSDAGEVFKPSVKASKSPFSLVSLVLLAAAVAAFFIWREGYFDTSSTQSALFEINKPEMPDNFSEPLVEIPVKQLAVEVSEITVIQSDIPASEVDEIVEAPVAVAVTETKTVVAEDDTISTNPDPVMTEEAVVVEEAVLVEEPVIEMTPVIVDNVKPLVSDSSGIVLKLTGKSWIEVRDSTGTFKLNNLYKAGTEKTFGGEPPYKVLIGNVAEASLMINGVAFDLENHSKANVARFTLDPSTL